MIYESKHNFYKYYNIKNQISNTLLLNKNIYLFLIEFYDDLEKIIGYINKKKPHKTKNMNVYDVASRIYNELLGIYLDR